MKDVKEKQEKECKKCRKKEGRDRGKEEQREECGGTGGEGRRLVTPDELDRSGAALGWRRPAPSTARNSPEAPLPPGTGTTDAHRSSPPPGPSPRPSPGTTAQAELRPRPPCRQTAAQWRDHPVTRADPRSWARVSQPHPWRLTFEAQTKRAGVPRVRRGPGRPQPRGPSARTPPVVLLVPSLP